VETLTARTGLVHTIAQRLIAVPGTSDLLTCLVADDPLVKGPDADDDSGFLTGLGKPDVRMCEAMDCNTDLAHSSAPSLSALCFFVLACGAGNPSGILLLAKEDVVNSLIETFVEGCRQLTRPSYSAGSSLDERSPSDSSRFISSSQWVRVSAAARTIGDICIRAMIVPHFNRANCSFGTRYTRMLNNALNSLSIFNAPQHVAQILSTALPCGVTTEGIVHGQDYK